jgi:hypothetical protein
LVENGTSRELVMYRTVEQSCSLDEMRKLSSMGGIYLGTSPVPYSGRETTRTYVFSKAHSPFRAISFMNEEFSQAIAETAGSLWWPENEKKYLLLVREEDQDGNEVTWLSQVVVIRESMLQKYPELADIKAFIDAASQADDEGPLPVVVTFESLFYLPVPYCVIDDSFKAACASDVISAMPFSRMPYWQSTIP